MRTSARLDRRGARDQHATGWCGSRQRSGGCASGRDLYQSTMDMRSSLYPRLSVGGFAIIDDEQVPACRFAVQDFRTSRGVSDAIVPMDGAGVYRRRT